MRCLPALALVAVLAMAAAAIGQDTSPAAAPPSAGDGAELRAEATDGPLAVVLTTSPARPLLGAPVALRLVATLDGDPTTRIEWPDVRALVRAGLGDAVVEVESARVAADGRSLDAVLRLYDEGRHELPPLTVSAVRDADTPVAVVTLEGLAYEVAADVPADAAPAPARPGLALEPPPQPFPWKLACVIGGLLVAIVIGGALLRRRTRLAPPPPAPPPPHELALAALRALARQGLPEQGAVEPYFVALSEILRRYLEDRFGLRAPEQTTEEFLADVSRSAEGRRAIESAQRDVLRAFLTQADLVKFARVTPSVDECASAGAVAERFVTQTAAEQATDADAGEPN